MIYFSSILKYFILFKKLFHFQIAPYSCVVAMTSLKNMTPSQQPYQQLNAGIEGVYNVGDFERRRYRLSNIILRRCVRFAVFIFHWAVVI